MRAKGNPFHPNVVLGFYDWFNNLSGKRPVFPWVMGHGSEDGDDGAGSYPESSEGAPGWSRKYASLR